MLRAVKNVSRTNHFLKQYGTFDAAIVFNGGSKEAGRIVVTYSCGAQFLPRIVC